jgi:DNA-directed RNA polymerase specialized sigma24 family protein
MDHDVEGKSGIVSDTEWALSVARRFRPVGILDGGDYAALALYGAWVARTRYRGGVKFRTFAYRFVKGAILRAIRDTAGLPAWAYERGARLEVLPLAPDWDTADGYREWQPEAAYMDREATAMVDALPTEQRRAVRHVVYGEGPARHQYAALYAGRKRLRTLCDDSL